MESKLSVKSMALVLCGCLKASGNMGPLKKREEGSKVVVGDGGWLLPWKPSILALAVDADGCWT
jgi:hypothetical protein